MSSQIDSDEAYVEDNRPWYESPDGTCNFLEPTLINMGEDKPLHLIFPVHWSEAVELLPEAKNMANERDAFLVLMLYGEASDSEIQLLIIELADAQVLPLWVGEENRRKFNRIIEMLSSSTGLNG